MTKTLTNVGMRLTETARDNPQGMAVAMTDGRDSEGNWRYRQLTFCELDEDSSRLAAGLRDMGVKPGMRLVLMVRPSINFISLVFALFKAGVVTVLIDPGMGRKNLMRCLHDSRPDGFVAISLVQAIRTFRRGLFPNAKFNVTVGRRWFWGGKTIEQLRQTDASFDCTPTRADDPAAIIFTTGSTGPPKGVLYRHGNFSRQVDEIQQHYGIAPGEIDLPCFPLFALFNSAMGVSTVIPQMDPTRPAEVNPQNLVEHINDWQVTQAFGSPALWNVVGRYCESSGTQLPTLRRVLSAGAPVPPQVLRRIKQAMHHQGEMHTPYGATESLPVASISASEVLGGTEVQSRQGAGTCVGRRFPGIAWKVIAIHDDPIPSIAAAREIPRGQIGELIVRGDVVTTHYATRTEANRLHKIEDGDGVWHRMGDVGYLDQEDRFWFCGRKSHRVLTAQGTMFTVPCEAIFNEHPQVYRTALVGVGNPGMQEPILVVELLKTSGATLRIDWTSFVAELRALGAASSLTSSIDKFLLHPSLPVDIRHNSKIFREKLAIWAVRQRH